MRAIGNYPGEVLEVNSTSRLQGFKVPVKEPLSIKNRRQGSSRDKPLQNQVASTYFVGM